MSAPGIDAKTAFATDPLHVVLVENLEGEAESILKLFLPLEKHRWRAGNNHFPYLLSDEQFPRDQPRLNGFSKADIICNE